MEASVAEIYRRGGRMSPNGLKLMELVAKEQLTAEERGRPVQVDPVAVSRGLERPEPEIPRAAGVQGFRSLEGYIIYSLH